MKISIPEKSKEEVSDSDIVEEQAKICNKWSQEEVITGCFRILVVLNMIILFILGPMIALPPTSFDHSGVRAENFDRDIIWAQISSLKDDFSSVKEDVKYLMGAMKSIQGRTANLEDGMESLDARVSDLEHRT